MGKNSKAAKTLPEGSQGGGASRPKLSASPKAKAHLKQIEQQVAARLIERQHRDALRAERLEAERFLATLEREAAAPLIPSLAVAVALRNITPEDAKAEVGMVTRKAAGPLTVLSRDSLEWLMRRGTLSPVHHQAGMRFRKDYELANGTGVMSSLAGEGAHGVMGPKSGPTDAMLVARDQMRAALKALGTPMLNGYVELIAGEGVMLTDPRFSPTPQRSAEHVLPCRIAFDLLARHYGMIR